MSIQLDLFEGKIFTTEQQLEITNYIEKCKKNQLRIKEDNDKIQSLLDEAGFIEGNDYINDFETFEQTSEVNFGYSYNNTQWAAEVSYMRSKGGCKIICDSLRDGKIETIFAYVYREGDKLQCTNITSQYRYYKPSSLLTKLKEHNSKTQREFSILHKEQSVLKYTVEKYKKLYPEAKIFIGTDYYRNRNYTEFKTVKVEFKSGSSVTFRLGFENDKELVHKSHDVNPLTTTQLLDKFNNQK